MSDGSKEQSIQRIAQGHFEVDPGVVKIFRIEAAPEREADPKEPVKLLEVYEHAIPSGIAPITLPPHPPSGVMHQAILIQIAPEELTHLGSELLLPDGWRLGAEIVKGESL